MLLHSPIGRWWPLLLVQVLIVAPAFAQDRSRLRPWTPNRYGAPGPEAAMPRVPPPARPPYRLADRLTPAPIAAADVAPAQPGEHPLAPGIRWAREGMANIERLQDYSATFIKRERIDGKLAEPEYLFLKVRHKPFSIYIYFLGPADIRGREVIFIEGQNNGNMWAHTTGIQDTLVGTVSLPPTGLIAMRGQRYPVTEIGILNLTRRLIAVGEQDMQYGECDVKYFKGAKINDRVCTCTQVIHPVPRRNFLFHLARIFADDELNLPIRYESYDWPKKEGETPELLEEYTYLDMKLNNGFTDEDFSTRNPNYKFR